ncbi:MAG: arginine--tRNA ligase [Candidatus Omnitrophica bacterium]|nr:arginine--tRNA ligase [Candidatus Omnitrophota bacterium]
MSPSSPELKETLKALLKRSVGSTFPSSTASTIRLEIPKSREHGDLTTTIAMRIASIEKREASEVARRIVSSLRMLLKENNLESTIPKIEVRPPGFINFFLSETQHRNILVEIIKSPDYGASSVGRGTKVQIEFVSANPTGPLSVAHGRQAAVGDTLARILQFCGYEVSREYYVNDVGNQIVLLGRSLYLRYRELFGERIEIPEGGYRGKYLVSLAKEIQEKEGDRYLKETDTTLSFFERYATEKILAAIQHDLEAFGVRFDHFTVESELRAEGKVEETLDLLRQKGLLFESEGATWFRSTALGDDKDRVVIKSDGSLTYLAPDIAYHREKFKDGFQRLINLWGPDHHGYIGRLRAAVSALGHGQETLSILILQLATLYRDGVVVPMSTRMGEFITLREVMEEVGLDAARFFFLMKKLSSHLDFDLALAKKQSLENPVYTIQYAHARISNIIAFGKIGEVRPEEVAYDLLKHPEELELLKQLRVFPETISSCARSLEPATLVFYLQKLAGSFHSFYQKHRVITEDLPLSRARTLLVLCIQQVLARGLSLLGVSAPDKM